MNNLRAHFNNMEKALRSTRRARRDRRRRAHGRGAGDSRRRTRSSGTSSCSAAAPMRARARSARPARPPLSRSASRRRSPSTRSARPTAACSTCSRTPSPQEPALHAADVLPAGLVQGTGQEHRSRSKRTGRSRSSASSAPIPEALREFGRRVRAVLRPAAAEAAGVSRGAQRDRRREEAAGALEDPERRDPRLRAHSASSNSGARTATSPKTRTSSRRRCSTPSSASTARSTTSRR